MITKEITSCFARIQPFSALPVELFDKLAVEIHARDIPKGTNFILCKEISGERIFLLAKGFARIEQFDSSDQFSYMDYIKRGALFPYGGMFQDDRYHYTASGGDGFALFRDPR